MPENSPAPQASKATAHLARVRDNQRRSRARRKEYLLELEEKFRRCEQTGVEASAEMQQAARQVLEENARLRAFLREKGHSEEELNAFTGHVGGSEDIVLEQIKVEDYSSAAQDLEGLLHAKKSCFGNSCRSNMHSDSRSPTEDEPSLRRASIPASAPIPSVSTSANPQSAQRQSKSSSARPHVQQRRQSAVAFQQGHPSLEPKQHRGENAHTQQPAPAKRDPSASAESLDAVSSFGLPTSGYTNYVTLASGLSDADSSNQPQPRMQPPHHHHHHHHHQAHSSSYPQMSSSRLSSGQTLGAPWTSFQVIPSYVSHGLGPVPSNVPPMQRPYDPSPMHSSMPSPGAFYFDQSTDSGQLGEFSDLLLAPEIQAQFLRGINMEPSSEAYGFPAHSLAQSGHENNVSWKGEDREEHADHADLTEPWVEGAGPGTRRVEDGTSKDTEAWGRWR